MNIKKIRLVLVLAIIITVIAGCAQRQIGRVRPSSAQFSSQWIDITIGGMMAFPETGSALALNLANKSSKALEVSVFFKTPDPKQQCDIKKQIKNKVPTLFQCPQTSVTPNVDYPIAITIYTLGEQGEKKLVEDTSTKFNFSEKDAKGFDQLLQALKSVEQ